MSLIATAAVARVFLLDHVRVLDGARGVVEDGDLEVTAVRVDLAHVVHRHGLAAGHVHRVLEGDVRDLLGPVLLDDRTELLHVDVTLPGVFALGLVRLVDDDVDEGTAGHLLVDLRRREVHVPGDELSGLDHRLGQHVLGGAALVGRDDVFVAVGLADDLDEAFVRVAPAGRGAGGVVVGPLLRAHGGRARVGEQVDGDVLGAQQKRVPARVTNRRRALRRGSRSPTCSMVWMMCGYPRENSKFSRSANTER
jgi:hypothetical protein